MELTLGRADSPLGPLEIVCDAAGRVRALTWTDRHAPVARALRRHGDAQLVPGALPAAVGAALVAYFAGDLAALDGIAVDAAGTAFQRAVWVELRRIPAGETVSYGDLARRVGRPRAVRAVAQANASNPIAVIVPCHRVIGADRTLTGYAGGLDRKRWLLRHEGADFVDSAGAGGGSGTSAGLRRPVAVGRLRPVVPVA